MKYINPDYVGLESKITVCNRMLFHYTDMRAAIQLHCQLGNEMTKSTQLRLRVAETMIKSYQESLEVYQNVMMERQHQEYLNDIWHSPPNFQLNVESQKLKRSKAISKLTSYSNKQQDQQENKINQKRHNQLIFTFGPNKLN